MSLLQRLRQSPGEQDWARFVQLYTPLIYSWARRVSLQPQDAADLVQDVFVILLRKLPELDYDRHKSFRSWLLTVTLNRWRDLCRRRACRPQEANPVALPNDIACPDGNELFSEAEYRQYLVARALKLMQTQFQPITWKACWEHVVSGRPAAEVAKELGITENAVYLAKGRVLRRLRDELTGLLE